MCPHFLDLTGGARGEEAGGPSDQWEPCFETLIVLHFQLFSKIVAHCCTYVFFEALTCCLGVSNSIGACSGQKVFPL